MKVYLAMHFYDEHLECSGVFGNLQAACDLLDRCHEGSSRPKYAHDEPPRDEVHEFYVDEPVGGGPTRTWTRTKDGWRNS